MDFSVAHILEGFEFWIEMNGLRLERIIRCLILGSYANSVKGMSLSKRRGCHALSFHTILD